MATEIAEPPVQTSKAEKRASRMSFVPASLPSMQVHPSHRPSDLAPPALFRTFANPIPVGLTAHGLGCLVYGSYCADWRNVSTPLLISALTLSVCAPGSFLATILCFISNETFWAISFMAVTGLWGFLGLAYLPVTGLLDFYTQSPELGRALQDSIAIVLVWYGIVAITLGFVILRRNVIFPVILLSSGVSLFVTAAGYFKHEVATSTLSKVGGYFLVISGCACAYYAVACGLAAERHWVQLPLGVFHDPHRLSDAERQEYFATHLGQRYPAFNNVYLNDESTSERKGESV